MLISWRQRLSIVTPLRALPARVIVPPRWPGLFFILLTACSGEPFTGFLDDEKIDVDGATPGDSSGGTSARLSGRGETDSGAIAEDGDSANDGSDSPVVDAGIAETADVGIDVQPENCCGATCDNSAVRDCLCPFATYCCANWDWSCAQQAMQFGCAIC